MIRKILAATALTLAWPLPGRAQQNDTQTQPQPPAAAAPAPRPPEAPKPPAATIYGSLNVNLQLTQAEGATNRTQSVRSRLAVSADSTNIGVRGSAAVNGFLQVVYQCETGANIDGINLQGICNRNSKLGLAGPWGSLFYGNWDTPYKAAAYGTKADDPFLNTDVYGFHGIMSSPGFNYRSGAWVTGPNTPIHGFDVRASNSVAYHSPRWMGLSGKAQVSVDEFKNASGTQAPVLYSGVVNFDPGPVSLLVAYERHEDGFALVRINDAAGAAFGSTAANTAGTATVPMSSTDQAWRAGAGFLLDGPLGATTVGGLFEQLILEQHGAPVGAVKRFSRASWQVSLKHRFGDHELRARYSAADSGTCTIQGAPACSTAGYGAQDIAVGYTYYLTGSAQVYVAYALITNERKAQYTFPVAGAAAVAGSTPKGADPQALGLGLRYVF